MLGAVALVAAGYLLWRYMQQAAASTVAPDVGAGVDPAQAWQPQQPAQVVPVGNIDPQAALDIVNTLNAGEFGGFFDPRDVMAVIAVESRFNPRAVGSSGEIGLMQVMPATARDRGFPDPAALFDPVEGIRAGMRQLKWTWDYLRQRLGADPTELQWFGAYNAGVGNILRGYQNVRYYGAIVTARDNLAFT